MIGDHLIVNSINLNAILVLRARSVNCQGLSTCFDT